MSPPTKATSAGAARIRSEKPRNGSLAQEDKDYNRQVNSHRAVIERVNAHLKNWHILKTRYRRPIKDFTNVIRAIIGMMFYNSL